MIKLSYNTAGDSAGNRLSIFNCPEAVGLDGIELALVLRLVFFFFEAGLSDSDEPLSELLLLSWESDSSSLVMVNAPTRQKSCWSRVNNDNFAKSLEASEEFDPPSSTTSLFLDNDTLLIDCGSSSCMNVQLSPFGHIPVL